jgi:hypothetical protein
VCLISEVGKLLPFHYFSHPPAEEEGKDIMYHIIIIIINSIIMILRSLSYFSI